MTSFFVWFFPIFALFILENFSHIKIETKLFFAVFHSLFLACYVIYNELHKLIKEIESRK